MGLLLKRPADHGGKSASRPVRPQGCTPQVGEGREYGAPERDAVKEPEASCYDRPALVETPAARARRMLSMNDPLPDRTTALDLGEAGPFSAERRDLQIGSASCRGRVCQYV